MTNKGDFLQKKKFNQQKERGQEDDGVKQWVRD